MKKFVLEQENDVETNYPLTDLFYAFFKIYKKWIEDRFGLDADNYPISYLIDKYKRQFYEEVVGETFESEEDVPEIGRWSIQELVTKLIKNNKVQIPTLRKQERFVDKYKNQIPMFIKRLDLPNYISISIEEEKPYEIEIKVLYDIDEVVKQEGSIKHPSTIVSRLIEYFKNYLNIKEGKPIHGDIDISYKRDPIFKDMETWAKNVLNGVIKKKIKQFDTKGIIRSVRFTPSISKSEIKLVFKTDALYLQRRELKDKVIEYLQGLGYNNIKVEITY